MPWYLKWFSKRQLIDILWAIARHVLKRIYGDAVVLVRRAENMPSLGTGYEKAIWVGGELVKRYDELREWKWLQNLVVELAVGEVKDQVKLLGKLKLPKWLRR